MQKKLNKKNSKLVFFDVTSLFTNIPHELGLKAIEYWLDKHSWFNKSFILKGYFVFNEEFFHQIAGTVMSTLVAPTYATLVMGSLETQFYE